MSLAPSWAAASCDTLASTWSSGTTSQLTVMPVRSSKNSFFRLVMARPGGVSSETTLMLWPLNWLPTSCSHFTISSGCEASRPAAGVASWARANRGRAGEAVRATPAAPSVFSIVRRETRPAR